ncbi:hypothetical protein C8F01DRAFT_1378548 [Mycena amicta]|nr:hypothetical protein C8F01DRAFT_1378548 [Mycena amicta]
MDSVGRDVREWRHSQLVPFHHGTRRLAAFLVFRFILDDTLSSSLLSDIQRVSRENGVPPTRISSSLDEISEDLARYDAEIARLAAHRQALHDLHEAGRSLWSPIRRLPVEVLTDIFAKSGSTFATFALRAMTWGFITTPTQESSCSLHLHPS